jgi:hypothetical protein
MASYNRSPARRFGFADFQESLFCAIFARSTEIQDFR